MNPGDRLLCGLVHQLPVDSKFSAWPPHITIIPWFRLLTPSDELGLLLKASYVDSNPFTIRVGDEAEFGYKKRKLVNLLHAHELIRLEGQSRRLFHSLHAWVVDEADNTRNSFRPHITVLPTGRVHTGDTIVCNQLYIVSQHSDYKQLDTVISL